VNIQLTSLEEMWYYHEENINHPEGHDYPVGVNEPHRELMMKRVLDSVTHRTGIDPRAYDSIIHATTVPGVDKMGNIITDDGVKSNRTVRNV